MIRVLFIVRSYSQLGGVEKVTRLLLRYLAAHYDVEVVTQSKEKPLPEVALKYYVLPEANDCNSSGNMDFLEKTIRDNHYGVIIDQGCISLVYRRFRSDEPYRFIQVLHGCPDWLYVRKRHPSRPVRGSGWKSVCRYLAARYIPFYSRIWVNNRLKEQFRHSAAFVLLDESFRRELLASFRSYISPGELHVIPNPLEPSPIRSKREKIVLYAGRFSYLDKRLDRLLRIWKIVEKNHADWKLQLNGDGPEKERLAALARRLQLKQVEFIPADGEEPIYAHASILCMTSSYEGWGLSIAEAQQAGVVPVAFDIGGGVRTLIGDNEYGRLVKPFSIKAYAETLGRLMDDKLMRDTLADNSMRHAGQYSMDRIGPMWTELIEAVRNDI